MRKYLKIEKLEPSFLLIHHLFQLKVLSEKLTTEEKKDFCITHFFNPVRYMGLLEIVKNENNDLS